MSDRKDREKYLTILDRFYRGRGGSLLTKDESEALDYAISSIKTDLKYDLLYEETNHIANVSKMIEPTADNNSAVDCIVDVLGSYTDLDIPYKREIAENILTKLPSVTPQNQVYPLCEDCHTKMDEIRRAYDNAMKQEPVLDKINKMKSEIADSLEFWDYSPNNNPLARDMLETLTNFWGDMREENE